MSTTPPEQPQAPAPPPPPPALPPLPGTPPGAILPVPGNAELAVYVFAAAILAIIWAASDLLDAQGFATLFTWLTIGYILSRGIAKASRVLEQ